MSGFLDFVERGFNSLPTNTVPAWLTGLLVKKPRSNPEDALPYYQAVADQAGVANRFAGAAADFTTQNYMPAAVQFNQRAQGVGGTADLNEAADRNLANYNAAYRGQVDSARRGMVGVNPNSGAARALEGELRAGYAPGAVRALNEGRVGREKMGFELQEKGAGMLNMTPSFGPGMQGLATAATGRRAIGDENYRRYRAEAGDTMRALGTPQTGTGGTGGNRLGTSMREILAAMERSYPTRNPNDVIENEGNFTGGSYNPNYDDSQDYFQSGSFGGRETEINFEDAIDFGGFADGGAVRKYARGGVIQTAGIALQAQDQFDKTAQEHKMNAQRIDATQIGMEEAQLWREIVKRAFAHEAWKKAQKGKAGSATAGAPVAREAAAVNALPPEAVSAPLDERAGPFGYKDGGAVQADVRKSDRYKRSQMPKSEQDRIDGEQHDDLHRANVRESNMPRGARQYKNFEDYWNRSPVHQASKKIIDFEEEDKPYQYADGGEVSSRAPADYDNVYDDTRVTSGMPKIHTQFVKDLESGHQFGSKWKEAAYDLASTLSEIGLANGGMIENNGVITPQNFANGGSLSAYAKSRFGGEKKKGAVKTKGGAVKGPGTGTSDSIKATIGGTQPARLSDGEYVLSADTVRAVGKDKLDALQARYHKPVR